MKEIIANLSNQTGLKTYLKANFRKKNLDVTGEKFVLTKAISHSEHFVYLQTEYFIRDMNTSNTSILFKAVAFRTHNLLTN
jgi:hypothetical protein